MAKTLFWLCLLLPFYAWVGYPLLLALLSLFVRPRPVQEGAPLSVSVIIAAHNEGPHIEHKLRTLLQQDYPATDLQIILASDGSSDDTVATALGVRDSRIVVLDLPRVGKAGALNAAVELARNDILVFTDADNQWSHDTLGKLLAPLSDPQVGACGGHMIIPDPGHNLSLGDSLYRHYEAWLRQAENRTGCMVSADGALLACAANCSSGFRPRSTMTSSSAPAPRWPASGSSMSRRPRCWTRAWTKPASSTGGACGSPSAACRAWPSAAS